MFEPESVERFQALVRRVLGLGLQDTLWQGVLAPKLKKRNLSLEAYCERLQTRAPEEWRALIGELTVQESHFFRNWAQFQALNEVAVPPRAQAGDGLNILSAGCAAGEEPYSIGIICRHYWPWLKVRIRALDLHEGALAQAIRGRYSGWALRETPQTLQARWFERISDTFQLDPEIRSLVAFQSFNLASEVPLGVPAGYDVIFCRNVLMYLDPPVAKGVVGRLVDALAPGGYLFLGAAESLRPFEVNLSACYTHGTFYYHKPAAPSAPTRPTRRSFADQKFSPVGLVPALDALLVEGRWAEAWALVGAADTQADPEIQHIWASIAIQMGENQQVEAWCRRRLLDVEDEIAHYFLGLCREAAGDWLGAENHHFLAIGPRHNLLMPRIHLAWLHRRQGDPHQARLQFEAALALLPGINEQQLARYGSGFSRSGLAELCRLGLAALGGHHEN